MSQICSNQQLLQFMKLSPKSSSLFSLLATLLNQLAHRQTYFTQKTSQNIIFSYSNKGLLSQDYDLLPMRATFAKSVCEEKMLHSFLRFSL